MKNAFTGIFLAALAATSSFGSLLGSNTGLDLQSLARAPNNKGQLRLNGVDHVIESVDGDGNVLDELEVTPEQEADLIAKHEAVVARIENQAPAKQRKSQDGLGKRRVCEDWASYCDEPADCKKWNCDDCFNINGMGTCYDYS